MDASVPDPSESPPAPPALPPGLTVLCQPCDGDGWRYVARGVLVDGRPTPVGKQEACTECGATGRISWRHGPGADLKRHERRPLPGY